MCVWQLSSLAVQSSIGWCQDRTINSPDVDRERVPWLPSPLISKSDLAASTASDLGSFTAVNKLPSLN